MKEELETINKIRKELHLNLSDSNDY